MEMNFVRPTVAVIGSGISGLAAGYWLSQKYEVSLFEANHYLGGHTSTIDIVVGDQTLRVDTGFIVFNTKTYPYFCKLLSDNNIAISRTEMSFSCRSDKEGIEYNGHELNTLFADRRNLFNPKFYRLLMEVIRFNFLAKKYLKKADREDITLEVFLHRHKFSSLFIDLYLSPMVESIWTKNAGDALSTSAPFIFQFCDHHGLLNYIDRPEWYVVKGGSDQYISALITSYGSRIFLNEPVLQIDTDISGVRLVTAKQTKTFDKVVIATHSDQALKMLTTPTADEQAVLSAIKYSRNDVILHTDSTVMPKRRLAWASWNYLCGNNKLPQLTYYMNRLQGFESKEPIFVSVNLTSDIDPAKIIKRFSYEHPIFDRAAIAAQKQWHLVNGKRHLYFVGAYWGYGFHEDGVLSARSVCENLGVPV